MTTKWPTGSTHPKLRELVLADLFDVASVGYDALKSMPFTHAGAVRPGLPLLFTTSKRLGRAMLRVVQGRADRFTLESADTNRVGA